MLILVALVLSGFILPGVTAPLVPQIVPSKRPDKLIPGNAYVFSLVGLNGRGIGPWHSFYALTPDTYFNIRPTSITSDYVTPQIKHISFLQNYTFKWHGPDPNRKSIAPATGIALALRMINQTYLYNMQQCNCRHYTDYLLYGETFGHPYDFTYMNMRDDCPLHAFLSNETDVNSPSFMLQDKRGKKYPLGPPIQLNQPIPNNPTNPPVWGPTFPTLHPPTAPGFHPPRDDPFSPPFAPSFHPPRDDPYSPPPATSSAPIPSAPPRPHGAWLNLIPDRPPSGLVQNPQQSNPWRISLLPPQPHQPPHPSRPPQPPQPPQPQQPSQSLLPPQPPQFQESQQWAEPEPSEQPQLWAQPQQSTPPQQVPQSAWHPSSRSPNSFVRSINYHNLFHNPLRAGQSPPHSDPAPSLDPFPTHPPVAQHQPVAAYQPVAAQQSVAAHQPVAASQAHQPVVATHRSIVAPHRPLVEAPQSGLPLHFQSFYHPWFIDGWET